MLGGPRWSGWRAAPSPSPSVASDEGTEPYWMNDSPPIDVFPGLDDPVGAGFRSKAATRRPLPGGNALWPPPARTPTGCGGGTRNEFEKFILVCFTLFQLVLPLFALFGSDSPPARAKGPASYQPRARVPGKRGPTCHEGLKAHVKSPMCRRGFFFTASWFILVYFTLSWSNLPHPVAAHLGPGACPSSPHPRREIWCLSRSAG